MTSVDHTPDGAALRWLVLDPALRSVQVQTSILDVLVNFLSSLQKCVFNVLSRLCTEKVVDDFHDILIKLYIPGLHKHEAILVSKLLGLLVGDVSLCLKITFVADEEDDSVRIS